jgi:hypothetical protein
MADSGRDRNRRAARRITGVELGGCEPREAYRVDSRRRDRGQEERTVTTTADVGTPCRRPRDGEAGSRLSALQTHRVRLRRLLGSGFIASTARGGRRSCARRDTSQSLRKPERLRTTHGARSRRSICTSTIFVMRPAADGWKAAGRSITCAKCSDTRTSRRRARLSTRQRWVSRLRCNGSTPRVAKPWQTNSRPTNGRLATNAIRNPKKSRYTSTCRSRAPVAQLDRAPAF